MSAGVIFAWVFIVLGGMNIYFGLRGKIGRSDHLWGKRPPDGKAGSSEKRAMVLLGAAGIVAGIVMLFHQH